jgi:hypothetical protein
MTTQHDLYISPRPRRGDINNSRHIARWNDPAEPFTLSLFLRLDIHTFPTYNIKADETLSSWGLDFSSQQLAALGYDSVTFISISSTAETTENPLGFEFLNRFQSDQYVVVKLSESQLLTVWLFHHLRLNQMESKDNIVWYKKGVDRTVRYRIYLSDRMMMERILPPDLSSDKMICESITLDCDLDSFRIESDFDLHIRRHSYGGSRIDLPVSDKTVSTGLDLSSDRADIDLLIRRKSSESEIYQKKRIRSEVMIDNTAREDRIARHVLADYYPFLDVRLSTALKTLNVPDQVLEILTAKSPQDLTLFVDRCYDNRDDIPAYPDRQIKDITLIGNSLKISAHPPWKGIYIYRGYRDDDPRLLLTSWRQQQCQRFIYDNDGERCLLMLSDIPDPAVDVHLYIDDRWIDQLSSDFSGDVMLAAQCPLRLSSGIHRISVNPGFEIVGSVHNGRQSEIEDGAAIIQIP